MKNLVTQKKTNHLVLLTVAILLFVAILLMLHFVGIMTQESEIAMTASVEPMAAQNEEGMQESLKTQMEPITIFFNAIMLIIAPALIAACGIFFGIRAGLTWSAAEDAETKKKAKVQTFNVLIGMVLSICALGILSPLVSAFSTMFGTHLL